MLKPIKYYLVLTAIIFLGFPVNAQESIYPGDVNNSGKVTLVDALYLNTVLGQAGTPRSEIGIEWEGYEFTPWGFNLTGLDLDAAFADCNGDGFVGESDLFAIIENFYFEHGTPQEDVFEEGEPAIDPKLEMSYEYEIEEDLFYIEIDIRNEGGIDDLQGCVLQLDVDYEEFMGWQVMDSGEVSWLADNDFELLSFELFPFFEDHLEVALIRKSTLGPVSGEGTLMRLGFIIVDDVIAFSEVDFETQVIIENALFVTDGFTDVPVVYDTLDIFIPKEEFSQALSSRNDLSHDKRVQLFPNPAKGNLNVITNKIKVTGMTLYSSSGTPVRSFTGFENNLQLKLDGIENGIYFMKIYTENEMLTQRIVILH